MSIWLDILCLILLILLNGFFAMSEISIVTARRSKLQMLADQGASGAELALSLSENPTRALSTIQVGITSIGILPVLSVSLHWLIRFLISSSIPFTFRLPRHAVPRWL